MSIYIFFENCIFNALKLCLTIFRIIVKSFFIPVKYLIYILRVFKLEWSIWKVSLLIQNDNIRNVKNFETHNSHFKLNGAHFYI